MDTFLRAVSANILNPLIFLAFAVAFLVFFYGLFQFIANAGESSEHELGKRKIIYGLIGMFVMFSAYGLIRVVLGTFGVSPPQYINR